MYNFNEMTGRGIISSSSKGITFEQLQRFGVVDAGIENTAPVSVEEAYRQEGWFKRCADVFGWSLSGLPWAITRGNAEEPIWTFMKTPATRMQFGT